MIVDVSAGGIEWRYRAMLLGDTAEQHSRVVWPSDLSECLSLMRQPLYRVNLTYALPSLFPGCLGVQSAWFEGAGPLEDGGCWMEDGI